MKGQVGGKRSTVCTHRYAESECLLKNKSTKHNKYVVNKKNSSILMISVSQNFLQNQSGFLTNKLCPFLFVSTFAIAFMKHRGLILGLCFSFRVGNSCVEGSEVKCFNAIAEG